MKNEKAGKYQPLWEYIAADGRDSFSLTFARIGQILGFPIDHAFLNSKKELAEYGYRVWEISMKQQTVAFEKAEA